MVVYPPGRMPANVWATDEAVSRTFRSTSGSRGSTGKDCTKEQLTRPTYLWSVVLSSDVSI